MYTTTCKIACIYRQEPLRAACQGALHLLPVLPSPLALGNRVGIYVAGHLWHGRAGIPDHAAG